MKSCAGSFHASWRIIAGIRGSAFLREPVRRCPRSVYNALPQPVCRVGLVPHRRVIPDNTLILSLFFKIRYSSVKDEGPCQASVIGGAPSFEEVEGVSTSSGPEDLSHGTWEHVE